MKDYYKILEVPHNASEKAIHDAYRKAVKKYHPDVAGTGSHERFLEIREAYEVLSNPERRRKYDLERGRRFYRNWKHSGYGTVRQPVRDVKVIRAELILTPSEAYRGGIFTVDVPFAVECPVCCGRWWLMWKCVNCGGKGVILDSVPVDIKVPPRVIPGMIIFHRLYDSKGREVRLELVCKIRRPGRIILGF